LKKSFVGILAVFLILALAGQAVASNHVVLPGDTLWLISQRYNTTVAEMVRENSLVNPNHIEVGQRLAIPGATQSVVQKPTHTVRAGETLWLIAMKYKTTVAAMTAENRLANPNLIKVGDKLVIPAVGTTPAAAATAATPATPTVTPVVSRGGRSFSATELDLFARLVHAEAAGELYLGQVAAAASILNRVDSSRYPNTLTGVINQIESGYYQYSPVLDGRINLPANESARRAVQDAINGQDPSLGATGFYNPRKTSNVWVRQQPVTVVIGNHVFFR
jgi:N-acetylmuramoyl-L-alanine amidase